MVKSTSNSNYRSYLPSTPSPWRAAYDINHDKRAEVCCKTSTMFSRDNRPLEKVVLSQHELSSLEIDYSEEYTSQIDCHMHDKHGNISQYIIQLTDTYVWLPRKQWPV